MRKILLICIFILITSKITLEADKPEEKVQNEALDDLDLFLSRSSGRRITPSRQNMRPAYRPSPTPFRPRAPLSKPSYPTYKRNIQTSRPNNQIYRRNIPTWRPNIQTSRPINQNYRRNIPTRRPNTQTSRPNVQTSRPINQNYIRNIPTWRPNTQTSRPNIQTSRQNIQRFVPNKPFFRQNSPIYGPPSPKPNLNNPISKKTSYNVKPSSTPVNSPSQIRTNSPINKFFNNLNRLPNRLPVINPLNNKKNINVGNKIKIGVENDFHNIKADGSYTNSRTLPSGIKKETKYSGSFSAKFEDGKKGVSGSIGKTSTTYRGIYYTQRGNEHSFSLDANHKDGNKGIEAIYTNTRTNGNGKKIGKYDISQSTSNEKKITGGGGIEKNGRIYGNGEYQNKRTNTKLIGYDKNKASISNYDARAYQISGGYRKTRNGGEIDGAFTTKNINGQKYSVGIASYSKENEVGNKYNGKINFEKNGGGLTGGYETYNQQTHKGKVGAIEASHSKKDYLKAEGGVNGSYNKGAFNGGISGSIARGQEHTAKFGDTKVTVGKEDKLSGNLGISASKQGVGINGQVQVSNTYKGSFESGKVKFDGSAGKSQTLEGKVLLNRQGINARVNYEENYSAQGKSKIGNKEIDGNGYASKSTYGGIGVKGDKKGGSVEAVVGREYRLDGQYNENGKQVGKVFGNAKAEGFAKIGANKKDGVTAEVGVRGEGKLTSKIIDYKITPEIGLEADKNGLHLKGVLNPGIDIKNGDKTIMHINGNDIVDAGIYMAKKEVKNAIQTGTNIAKAEVAIAGTVIKSGINKIANIFKPSQQRN